MRASEKGCTAFSVYSGEDRCRVSVIPNNDHAKEYSVADAKFIAAGTGWHIADASAEDGRYQLSIDGRPLCSGTDVFSSHWDGTIILSLWGNAPIDVDWVLVTRY